MARLSRFPGSPFRKVHRKSPVYTYEPGLNDLTSLMVPAVAAARCGIGLGGLVQGIIE